MVNKRFASTTLFSGRAGEAERVGLSYLSRILRLTLLAPDVVGHVLDGRPTAELEKFLKPFPVEWERQRERLC
jgi:hypothetical protein